MVHSFKFDDIFIALDVESGALHLLDREAYDVLCNSTDDENGIICQSELPYSVETVNEILSEFNELKAAGELYTPEPKVDIFTDVENQPIKSMCLHVAHDCNLRCRYCFAGTGEFSGERMLMDVETAKKAIDFLIENSLSRHNLELDFFGGEPLLNMDVVKATVAYGREQEKKFNKHFNFTITTNGVALTDDIIDYINENMHNVVISLDGRKSIHDYMRPSANGKPSYDVTLKNALKLVSRRGYGEYYIRGTYTNRNLDFAEDVFSLYKEGFKHISVEPVVLDDNDEFALTEAHLPTIFAEYEKLAKMISDDKKNGGDLHFFHFSIDMSHGPCLKRRIKGCGAGFEYVAVAPNGDIYPCHQFVGDEKFIMGNVHKSGFDKKMKSEFMECSILTKEKCKTCFAKYFCSGGCSANAYKYNGSIYKPHELTCSILRKRTECAIGLYAQYRS